MNCRSTTLGSSNIPLSQSGSVTCKINILREEVNLEPEVLLPGAAGVFQTRGLGPLQAPCSGTGVEACPASLVPCHRPRPGPLQSHQQDSDDCEEHRGK